MNAPFHIKICGVKAVADALASANFGADAIGLNFFPPSARSLTLEQAREIAKAVPAGVKKVGVFVNESLERVHEIAEVLALDIIQLHGDESPEFVAALAGRKVIRAFAATRGDADRIADYVVECRQLAGVLIDAYSPVERGGTGKVADWQLAAELRERLSVPLILAGGLTPANVAAAIAAVRPCGVDTASGVELSPGVKDQLLMRQFIEHARAALSS